VSGNNQVTNVLMVGVGGQGVLLASEVLSEVMMRAGYDVKKSEVHGMAQRGGSVSSHVRFGQQVYSPLIQKGDADILFSFELLEALRYFDYLRDTALVIVNNQKVLPPSVTLGADHYPDNVPEVIKRQFSRFELVDALGIARSAGTERALNIAFLGALSKHITVDEQLWKEVISSMLPPKLVEVNLKAFLLGRETKSALV
jgi:indolepyruvate ferredoxin oxidoreductase beta subunit